MLCSSFLSHLTEKTHQKNENQSVLFSDGRCEIDTDFNVIAFKSSLLFMFQTHVWGGAFTQEEGMFELWSALPTVEYTAYKRNFEKYLGYRNTAAISK